MTRPVVGVALRLLIAVINVPRKVGRKAWIRCFKLTAQRAHLFGMNEAGWLPQKRVYQRLARQLGLTFWGLFRGPNPVFWDPDIFRKLSARQIKLHARAKGRLAQRWIGFNAARYLTEVVLRHIATKTIIAVLNTHLVPPGPKVEPWWRARMRKRSLARIRSLVHAHLAAGRIVVLMGDHNLLGKLDIPGVTWLVFEGVDKLAIAVPAGVSLDGFSIDDFLAPTDHKRGHAAEAHLTIGAAA